MVTDDPPPVVTITSPTIDVIAGEVITLAATATDNGSLLMGVGFAVDGNFEGTDLTEPFSIEYRVPYDKETLEIQAWAADNLGGFTNEFINVNVVSDPGTTVVGSVQDGGGSPVVGADVDLAIGGLTASFYQLNGSLVSIPDFTGLTPNFIRPISASNLTNESGDLDLALFAAPLTDQYGIRLVGTIQVDQSGDYSFGVTADDGAALYINNTLIVSATGTGGMINMAANTFLQEGRYPVEVRYYQNSGTASLRLTVGLANTRGSGIGIGLLQDQEVFTDNTDGSGDFSIADAPSVLGDIFAQIRAGGFNNANSLAVTPVQGGTTDLGTVTMTAQTLLLKGDHSGAWPIRGALNQAPVLDLNKVDLGYEDLPRGGTVILMGDLIGRPWITRLLQNHHDSGGSLILAGVSGSTARLLASPLRDGSQVGHGQWSKRQPHPLLNSMEGTNHGLVGGYRQQRPAADARVLAHDSTGSPLMAMDADGRILALSPALPKMLKSTELGEILARAAAGEFRQ